MNPIQQLHDGMTRRSVLTRSGMGIGALALSGLLNGTSYASDQPSTNASHFAPRAKRVIYLGQFGGPSQIETFDYKPGLAKQHGKELPASIRMGQRLTTMTSGQSSFPVVASKYSFKQCGQSGQWLSDLLPHKQTIADEMCIIRSVHTEAINHDPAVSFLQTGSQLPGRPSLGAWLSYGLGSENQNLPAFVVLVSNTENVQPLSPRVWGNGFLPSRHQGIKLRAAKDPVLYLSNPPGVIPAGHRQMLNAVGELNSLRLDAIGDPEIAARIAQYEMAFRMQTSVPDLMDDSDEPEHVREMYGPDVNKPGSFAANCLLARRMAERGVRFIQVYQRGWDHHSNLPGTIPRLCKHVDQPSAALIRDLKQRGMLDDTLVIWAGEFGRTVYCQGGLTPDNYGRDHHGRCFSIWMAGGGIKPGISYGKSDDFSYNVAENPMHIHDLNATLLHCLGVNHEQLVFKSQGRDFRLTDVHGSVNKMILTHG